MSARTLNPYIYSRYTDSDPLVNLNRRNILRYIKNHPNTITQEISEETNIPHSTTYYHLNILCYEGLIEEKEVNNRKEYTTNQTESKSREKTSIEKLKEGKNESSKNVIEAISQYDGKPSTKDIACLLNVTPSAVSQHLKTLEKDGIITRHPDGRKIHISLTIKNES